MEGLGREMSSRQLFDIQREAEAMQMVWLQEHTALQTLAAQVEAELGDRSRSESCELCWQPLAARSPMRRWPRETRCSYRRAAGAELVLTFQLGGENIEPHSAVCSRDLAEPPSWWNLKIQGHGVGAEEVIVLPRLCYEMAGQRQELTVHHEAEHQHESGPKAQVDLSFWGTWPEELRRAEVMSTAAVEQVYCFVEVLPGPPVRQPLTIGENKDPSERTQSS
ncbi:unnamed protein product [Durusdinium trenchii]|uniref:Uncharacterized protein n=1 Tax=Durusdinium trenchii TaxID=1381693 RepID=A0ABP0HCX3_9DINO